MSSDTPVQFSPKPLIPITRLTGNIVLLEAVSSNSGAHCNVIKILADKPRFTYDVLVNTVFNKRVKQYKNNDEPLSLSMTFLIEAIMETNTKQ